MNKNQNELNKFILLCLAFLLLTTFLFPAMTMYKHSSDVRKARVEYQEQVAIQNAKYDMLVAEYNKMIKEKLAERNSK